MQQSGELKRTLGLTSAMAVIVGGVIGSGIFLKPLSIAQSLPSPIWVHASWVVLGVICLFGAFAYSELGTMYPEAGGQYAFLREGWGRFPAFLYGWCLFLVINTGTMAALAVAFADSLASVVDLTNGAQIAVAVGMIVFLAAINHCGVNWGAAFQNLSTFAKVAALTTIAVGGFLVAGAPPAAVAIQSEPSTDLVTGLVVAAIAIFWAYEGWYQLPFNAAELRDPKRDLPRGMIFGTALLIVLYVSVNAVYLHMVPIGEMRTLASDIAVPRTAVERIFGTGAANGLSFLICLSILGSTNPCLLSTTRAFYAMAKDGVVMRAFMRIHPVHRTPVTAIWAQALWSIALIGVLETFRDITEYVIFAALIFYGLTVASVYRLRRSAPNHPRPYRCWGYPVTPALFIAVVVFVDVWTLRTPDSRNNALMGLLILAVGAVVYLVVQRARSAGGARHGSP